jgi:hypothetical protein
MSPAPTVQAAFPGDHPSKPGNPARRRPNTRPITSKTGVPGVPPREPHPKSMCRLRWQDGTAGVDQRRLELVRARFGSGMSIRLGMARASLCAESASPRTIASAPRAARSGDCFGDEAMGTHGLTAAAACPASLGLRSERRGRPPPRDHSGLAAVERAPALALSARARHQRGQAVRSGTPRRRRRAGQRSPMAERGLGASTRVGPRASGSGDQRAAQTGEQDSVPATRNEDPQPQAATTFGLFTLNPAPIRAST